jgi:superfamily II DNA helicase RecQ
MRSESLGSSSGALPIPHNRDRRRKRGPLSRGGWAIPVIATTCALGVGFDYPHVRWVIHVDASLKMTDFSQESGRAGRDGWKACSIVMLVRRGYLT